jgi:hypothetical protein
MADDDKIVIPVEITTEDAKKALDDLASTASSAFDKVASKADDAADLASSKSPASAASSPSSDVLEPPAPTSEGLGDSANKLNDAAEKLSDAADKLKEQPGQRDDGGKRGAESASATPGTATTDNKSRDPSLDSGNKAATVNEPPIKTVVSESVDRLTSKLDEVAKIPSGPGHPDIGTPDNKSHDALRNGFDFGNKATDSTSRYPLPTTDDAPAKAAADSIQHLIYTAAKRAGITSDEFKQRHDEIYRDASGSAHTLSQALHAAGGNIDGRVTAATTTDDGTDALSGKLKNVGEVGDSAFKKIKGAIGDVSSGGGLGNIFSQFTSGAEGGEKAAEKLREAIHILHPVLEEAGVSLGNIGAFARLAGAGMGALGVAVGGTVLVALAKLADEADKTKRRLDLLSNAGRGGGESQYENLKKLAHELGVDPADLASGAETLFKGQQTARAADRTVTHSPTFVAGENEDAANRVQIFRGGNATPSSGLSSETLNTAIKAAIEAGRADNSSTKESVDALKGLYESTKGGKGLITTDALDNLPPAISEALAKALSGSGAGGTGQQFPQGAPDLRAFIARGGRVTGDQALLGLARTEPDLRKQADAIPPSVAQSLEHLEAAAKRAADALAGDLGIASAIEKLAKLIDGIAEAPDKLLHPRDYEPGGAKFIGPVSPAEAAEHEKFDPADFLLHGPKSLQQTPEEALTKLQSSDIWKNASKLLHGDLSNAYLPPETRGRDQATIPEQKQPQVPVAPRTTDEMLDRLLEHKPRGGRAPGESIDNALEQPDLLGRRNPFDQRQERPLSLDYDRTSDGLLIRRGPESQQPSQPEAAAPQILGPRSEAAPAPAQPNQQVASLGGEFQRFIDAVSSALRNANPRDLTQPSGEPTKNLGIRGEGVDNSQATSQIAALGVAAGEAAAKLRGIETPAAAAPQPATVAEGGHIRGAGTATSDSIPAMLSDGEYVLKEEAVRRIGVENLDAVNSGAAHLSRGGEVHHYADGGNVSATSTTLPPGHHQITATQDGGAIIDGVKYPHGSQILQDPVVQNAIKAAGATGDSDKPTHKSDFVGIFGGHVFDTEGSYAKGGLVAAFSRGGLAGNSIINAFTGSDHVDSHDSHVENSLVSMFAHGGHVGGGRASSVLQHFNTGGLAMRIAHFTAPPIMLAGGGAAARSAPEAATSEMEHWGTVDLRTDRADFKAATQRDTMRHLNASAQSAKRFSTGGKPGWYGG